MNLKSHGSFWASLAEKHLGLKGYAKRCQFVRFEKRLHGRRGSVFFYFEYCFLAKCIVNGLEANQQQE